MKLILILGCQRSGTTLTAQILGGQPNAFLIDEGECVYPWFNAWVAKNENSRKMNRRMLKRATQKYTDERSGFSSIDELSSMHVVLKVPNLTYRTEDIAKLNDQVHLIFPTRDVRSVVASMIKLGNRNMVDNQIRYIVTTPKLAAQFTSELATLRDNKTPIHIKQAIIWAIKTGYCNQYAQRSLNPFIFKYEDLVKSPGLWTERLTAHCEITIDGSAPTYNEVMSGEGPGHTTRQRPVDTQSLELWRETLSAQQEADILGVSGDTMRLLGY